MTAADSGIAYIVKAAFRVVREEVSSLRPRIHALQFVAGFVPPEIGSDLCIKLLRSMGCSVGAGTFIADVPKITGLVGSDASNLRIGQNCTIQFACEFEIAETITIGDNVKIGHQSLVLTTTHELGPRTARAGAPVMHPVVIENGVAIGPRCVILPGVTIGSGAIVEPCSVVNANVPAHTRVSGTPAKHVEALST